MSREAAEVILETLKLVAPVAEPVKFLQGVEDSSALLVQKEGGVYGFAHLTFQEYLASLHIKEERLSEKLASCVGQTWWHETARLYAAQADATPIVASCFAGNLPTVDVLLLAADCESEALQLRADLREELRLLTERAIEDPEPELRTLAAEYLLARRIRGMARIDDDHYVDSSPITHAEYQLIIDETRASGEFRQPDHWESYRFAPGTGRNPVVGIRKEDAESFCDWLSQRTPGEWNYSLPTRESVLLDSTPPWRHLRFFTADGSFRFRVLAGWEIAERVRRDAKGEREAAAATP